MAENTPVDASKSNLSSESWLKEIATSKKWLSKWHKQGAKIVSRFLDERDTTQEAKNKINLFASNTLILISTLYARFPKPLVVREFEDPNDDIARVAAEMMERALKVRAGDDFDTAMKYVVQDRLVPGLGNLWFRYEPTFMKVPNPLAQVDPFTGLKLGGQEAFIDQISSEKVCVDYVYWEDFFWSPARIWEDVRWIARRVKMTREDASKRFGEVIAGQLTYSDVSSNDKDNPDESEREIKQKCATVFEIWCKTTKEVVWVSEGFHLILDKKPDPLGLENFWPCPKPLFALTSTKKLIPRPDYLMAQDQYEELDMINNRITMLERAIKVVGIYDGTNSEIEQIFTEGMDNRIIPSRSFKDFMEKGGFKGSMDWLPIEAIVNALERLRSYRQDLMSQIYEITGISDIMRGSTKASETLGAQQLKAQYGSVKLQFLQMEVATFVSDALKIKAEIIREFFVPESILKITNANQLYDQELIQPAIELIKNPDFEYRVEVHADSMAVPEFNAERDGRMQFLRSIAEMMTAVAPILQQEPTAGALFLEIIKWAASSFRTGRQIEGVLDKAIKQIQQAATMPKPPTPPNPKDVAQARALDARANLDASKAVQTDIENVLTVGPAALAMKSPAGAVGVPNSGKPNPAQEMLPQIPQL